MKPSALAGFKNKNILLVGDAILDVYIHGASVGQGLGTTVPRVEERSIEVSYGGNGLIAKNILELGGKVHFVSIIGDDEEANKYKGLSHARLTKHFIVDKSRPTIVKHRIFADGVRLLHLNRVDHRPINAIIEKKVIAALSKLSPKVDAIVVMDPQHGMLTSRIISSLLALAKKYKVPLYVDTQISHSSSNHHLYRGVHTMFLNENEAKAVHKQFNPLEAEKSLRVIRKKLEVTDVIVKLGEHGSIGLVGDKYIKTPAAKVDAVDPCGAGDAFLSAYCLGNSDSPEATLQIANAWAALSTTIHGTTPPRKQALIELLASL